MTSAARKAWNDAMKATAGAAALPPALQGRTQKRRSDRHKSKQDRRSKARKVLVQENDEFRTAVWMDALEGVDPSTHVADDDDDEFNEFSELQDDNKKKRGRGRGQKQKAGAMPKRFIPRSLGTILLEEANREDGVTRSFLSAEARLSSASEQRPKRKFCPVTGLEALYTEPKSGISYYSMSALEQIQERPPPWMTLGGAATYWEATKSIVEDSY